MLEKWNEPTKIPPVADSALQVWRMGVEDLSQEQLGAIEANLLSQEEQARAARMWDRPRREFVAARGLLRRLLGAALEIHPARVMLEVGENRKPRLGAPESLHFNLSHSAGLILIALSRMGDVGVDVEWVDERLATSAELLEIARAALQPAEVAEIEQAESVRAKLLAFYAAWTRKEAVTKADGRGIAYPSEYTVATEEDKHTCRILLQGAESLEPVEYMVHRVPVGPDHVAALAIRGGRTDDVVLLDASGLGF